MTDTNPKVVTDTNPKVVTDTNPTAPDLDGLARLRVPFPAEAVGKLPKTTCRNCSESKTKVCDKHSKKECVECGNWMTTAHLHLDYVGHAAVTDRLLEVDPLWSWEPMGRDEFGNPAVIIDNNEAEMWIRLTVCGVTRLGVGTCSKATVERSKQLISDAIRNAAMRFGVALDLWSKEGLSHPDEHTNRSTVPVTRSGRSSGARTLSEPAKVSAQDSAALLMAMDDVVDADDRKAAKVDFVKAFAKPDDVRADRLVQAWEWLTKRLEVDAHRFEPGDEAGQCSLCGTLERAPWHDGLLSGPPDSPVPPSGPSSVAVPPQRSDGTQGVSAVEQFPPDWVAAASKSDLVAALGELGADGSGTVSELRTRLADLLSPF